MKTFMIVIPADDSRPLEKSEFVSSKRGEQFEAAQSIIGGFLTQTRIKAEGKVVQCWLDEDGYAKRLPINRRVTQLQADFLGQPPNAMLCGTAVYFVKREGAQP